ncbi:unnamed protein product [Darwinula stevensoni]|uniref:Uncharacterized protein n=1 Tax=Darwinula stevensoni TaxID=69355 RepID=A0A7R8XBB9_9CRUS|nr:unnamed protein product [Darwinula stevensoni]CAG0887596.1 unnamed protein product [Darwinula stevensoni]
MEKSRHDTNYIPLCPTSSSVCFIQVLADGSQRSEMRPIGTVVSTFRPDLRAPVPRAAAWESVLFLGGKPYKITRAIRRPRRSVSYPIQHNNVEWFQGSFQNNNNWYFLSDSRDSEVALVSQLKEIPIYIDSSIFIIRRDEFEAGNGSVAVWDGQVKAVMEPNKYERRKDLTGVNFKVLFRAPSDLHGEEAGYFYEDGLLEALLLVTLAHNICSNHRLHCYPVAPFGRTSDLGQIYEKLELNKSENMFGPYEDGMQRTLKEHNYAIVGPVESVLVSNHSCHLVTITGRLASQRLSIALTKNSIYTNLFNHLIDPIWNMFVVIRLSPVGISKNEGFNTMQNLTKRHVGRWERGWMALRQPPPREKRECLYVTLFSNEENISFSKALFLETDFNSQDIWYFLPDSSDSVAALLSLLKNEPIYIDSNIFIIRRDEVENRTGLVPIYEVYRKGQGAIGNPRHCLARAVLSMSFAVGLIIVTAYSAVLTSYLAVDFPSLPFEKWQGILNVASSWKLGVLNESSVFDMFSDAYNTSVQWTTDMGKIYEKLIMNKSENQFWTYEEGMWRSFTEPNYAYVGPEESVYVSNYTCQLVPIPGRTDEEYSTGTCATGVPDAEVRTVPWQILPDMYHILLKGKPSLQCLAVGHGLAMAYVLHQHSLFLLRGEVDAAALEELVHSLLTYHRYSCVTFFDDLQHPVVEKNERFRTMKSLTDRHVGRWVTRWDALRETLKGEERGCLYILFSSEETLCFSKSVLLSSFHPQNIWYFLPGSRASEAVLLSQLEGMPIYIDSSVFIIRRDEFEARNESVAIWDGKPKYKEACKYERRKDLTGVNLKVIFFEASSGRKTRMALIYEKLIVNKSENMFAVYDDGMKRTLKEPNYAFVGPTETVSFFNYTCSLVPVPGDVSHELLSIAFTKDSIYTNIFNHFIARLHENGILTRIKKRWITEMGKECLDSYDYKEATFFDIISLIGWISQESIYSQDVWYFLPDSVESETALLSQLKAMPIYIDSNVFIIRRDRFNFENGNWSKSLPEWETTFAGGRPEDLSQESKNIIVEGSGRQKKSCTELGKEIQLRRVEVLSLPFEKWQDILSVASSWKLGVMKESSDYDMFFNAYNNSYGKTSDMGQIFEKLIINKTENLFGPYEEGMGRTLTEPNYAFVGPAESVSVSNYTCELVAIPGELASERLSIALTKDSSYTNLFSHFIARFHEEGILQRIKDRWTTKRGKTCYESFDYKESTFTDIQSLIVFLSLSMLLSVIVLFLELFRHSCRKL